VTQTEQNREPDKSPPAGSGEDKQEPGERDAMEQAQEEAAEEREGERGYQ
jgi:hypothetical protein